MESLRNRLVVGTLAAALVALLPASASAQSGDWSPMPSYNPKRDPGAERNITSLWGKYVSETPAVGLAYQTYRVGDANVTVLLGQSASVGCDNGPNSGTSEQNWSTCPIKVLIERGGKVSLRNVPDGCYIDGGGIDGAPNDDNRVETRLDGRSRTLSIRTRQNGQVVPDCQKSLSLD